MATPDITKTITFTLPSEMVDRLEATMREQGRSQNELLTDAIHQYLSERERLRWEELLARARCRTKVLGIKPEDVPRLIEEYRDAQSQA